MSIIYGTLERLEANTPPSLINGESTQPLSPVVAPKGLHMKLWATAIAVVMAGTVVMLWPRDGGAGTSRTPAAINTAAQDPVVETSIQQPALVSVGDQVDVGDQESVGKEISAPDEVVPAAPAPPEAEASTVAQRDSTSEQASAQQAVAASVTVAPVTAVVAEPRSAQAVVAVDRPDAFAVDEVIEEARMALSRGNYQQALMALEKLDPVPEDRSDFWLIKGSAHLGAGQLDPAGAAFAAAQALAPQNVQIAVQQAILKQEQGDHAGALQILEQAAARHPDMPEIYLNQGYSQLALGAERDAKRSFRTFLQVTEGRSLYLQQRTTVSEWLAQVSAVPQ